MAVKSFIDPSIKYVPQAGFSVVYTENGGVEASQDFLIRNATIQSGNAAISGFVRGATWESLWPEVPQLYRLLTLKTHDPTDRGDGWSILKTTFTGYQFSSNGSSGEESTVPTTSLVGQLEDVALAQHPKWSSLSDTVKNILNRLISGDWVYDLEEQEVGYIDSDGDFRPGWASVNNALNASADGVNFANIIASGESTYRRGGWTYSYHTESKTGFSAGQLNSLGKIVNTPLGNPINPSSGYKWLLVAPNQTQSGVDRFMKTLDYQLIPDNATNDFLYG